MKIDGLVSGLKTADLIDSLMKVQAIPQSQLTAKITDRNTVIGNLQSLNTSLQSLFDKATTASAATSLAAFTPSSSAASVTVTASEKASAFSTSIVVDAVARAHSVVTAAGGATSWGGTFTLVAADGTQKEITPLGSSAEDLAKAVNASKSGVTATVVPAGTAADGTPLSRIQLTADKTGAANRFTLDRGSAADVAAGTAVDLSTEAGAAVIAQGADASIRLFAGTAAQQTLTSASNTITVANGIDVTVSQVSADPVTITVATDAKTRTASAQAFVTGIAGLLTRIDNGSTATIGKPGEATTLGVFTGDSTVRALRGDLADAVQAPVDGISPSTIGISITEKGVLQFDGDKFAKALADDPEAVQSMFSRIAGRVQDTTSRYSDKYDGMLTQRITGQQAEVQGLQDQVKSWDIRLDQRRANLERTYSQLEVKLSALQSQSSWLGSQLAAFAPPTPSSSS
ncbi:flagellar filament capping protein FliD [Microbacterium sp. ASV81]|uniref:Flagellar hook-associated protein 2 n=1 Tax=Microbacterium capsulatum TaxID=3041921 RepID=A0ABU0XDK1_9MICO|nr:flagellar filament capping protein FliD [Microbacterium sp. ASV81]MDQ4213190.1 flagellar filament capping protein FliD [Microbacterium sp. ASV81]